MRSLTWHVCAFAAMLLFPLGGKAQSVPSGFNDAVVIGGFTEPVGFTFDANGRLYVWEKAGKVWIVENGTRLPAPLIDISEEVGNWRDHGCLGFALDPDFLSNGRMYLLYTVDRHYLMHYGTAQYDPQADEYYSATIMRLTRYTAVGPAFNTVDPGSRLVLIGETKKTGIPLLHESHSTGMLAFGNDGTLLLTAGDAASYNAVDVGNDPQTYYAQALADSIIRPAENVGAMRSQLTDCMNGKMLRIDPATGNGVASNPYYDASAPRAPRSRVWAQGLRNAYRFSWRPGTGSTDPAVGDPGVFYIGDVGWTLYEEMDVCYTGGQNFGWPLFEGMEVHNGYWNARTQDLDAPNPLYGQGGCIKPCFDFQDLIIQETLIHPLGLPNPCDPQQLIPPTIPVFTHSRPTVDWTHGSGSRCSAFNGNNPVWYDLDDPQSPVPGPLFGGNASVGGGFVAGAGWPAGYQDSYFFADYGGAWIRRANMAPDDKAVEVFDFGSSMGAVVFLREGPDGALWYVRYETGEIRKVAPLGVTNLPPVAVAQQDVAYGPGPLGVQFTGSGSSDPEGGPLTYEWDFGDGGSSSVMDPFKIFNAPPGVPTVYTVTLTVRDDQDQPNVSTITVNVNNTPPVVAITSFPDSALYPVGVDTTFNLVASVTDTEQATADLDFAWQTILHHNVHVHPEPEDHAMTSSTVISGIGCYGETYYYEVRLTVTDGGGLSTTDVHFLYPNCLALAPVPSIVASVEHGPSAFTSTLDASGSVDNGSITSFAWDFGDGSFASGPVVEKTFSELGEYHVILTLTDNDGLISTAEKVITVYDLSPPACPGSSGSILRQYWTGISGTAVSALLNNSAYPDQPSGTTYPTSIRGPVNFGDNYGTRMRGYIIPPATGGYTFNITSDDASEFYLSPNADPAFKESICSVPGWTNDTEYGKYASQQSGTMQLTAGTWYYFEFIQKEGGGGDHMTVRWTQPGNATLTVVGGTAVAQWADCPPNLSLRMVLGGPYDAATGLMKDDLRAAGLIPALEPYTALGYLQVGGGGETVAPATLAITGKNAVVDWVLVELRDQLDPAVVVATRCALLQRDGDVVGTDGHAALTFGVPAGNYYVAARHRNHLGVMTATPVAVGPGGAGVDLILPNTAVYGTGARMLLSAGKWGYWPGNASGNGQVAYNGSGNDREAVLGRLGGTVHSAVATGYWTEDVNLDGKVKYTGTANDCDLILRSLGGSTPDAVRNAQLP
jgi:glucose/arabinose dehydrogenase/PKD repeat protein